MADGVIHVLPEGIGQEQYDAVNEKLSAQGDPPPGLQFHAAGAADDGRFRIIEVWDSRDSYEAFRQDRLGPAIAEVTGAGPDGPTPDDTWFPVHAQQP
jgi:hypothetical protein